MSGIKYSNKRVKFERPDRVPPFDIQRLNSKRGLLASLGAKFLRNSRWWLKLLRKFWPTVKVGRVVLLTRADDVQEALLHPNIFAVPFGEDMKGVSGGGEFILGMDNGAVYRAQKSVVLTAFPPDKMAQEVTELTLKSLARVMPMVPAEFDAMQDVLKKVALGLCESYFGLKISDKKKFYESTLAVSSFLFADIGGSKALKELAVTGSDYLIKVIDHSIGVITSESDLSGSPLARLVTSHREDPAKVPLKDIRSIMIGMISGFLPTTILGAGNALNVILNRADARTSIDQAIALGDDDALDLAIVEAMRFNPIQIGPFRVLSKEYTIAEGTKRAKTLPENSLVIPSTLSAMFDEARVPNPDKFDPTRAPQNSMIFGYGIHTCIGAPMARAFSTQVFKAIFSLKGIDKAKGNSGCMDYLGIFPNTQGMRWEGSESYADVEQSMNIVLIPIVNTTRLLELNASLEQLGNVAESEEEGSVAHKLKNAQIIHMVSAFVVPEQEPGSTPYLSVEINGDGGNHKLIDVVAGALQPAIGPLVCDVCDLDNNKPLADHFSRYALESVSPLSRQLGLNFSSTPGHSVKRILKEQQLFDYLADYLKQRPDHRSLNANALQKLEQVREHLTDRGDFGWAFAKVRNRLNESGQGLLRHFLGYFKSPWCLFPILVLLGFVYLNFQILGGVQASVWLNFWRVGAAISMMVIGGVLIFGAALAVIAICLRRLERKDPTQFSVPSQEKYDAITAKENQILQNHMAAVSMIKSSRLRMILLRAVLWYVGVSAAYRHSSDEVSVIDTIHFAKWVKIPKTRQMIFLSNYGGSWESYLEDFITKGASGLTGIWSNTKGFPRTRYLFQCGAKLSEPFKNWARDQQMPTPFWFIAYPNITTAQIRKNALIREGLASINDNRDAEEWCSLFGSSDRPMDNLDVNNIQSMLFNGLGKYLHDCRFLAISFGADSSNTDVKALTKLMLQNVNFGEHFGDEMAVQAAFSYQGLSKMGLKQSSKFANVFQQGMVSSARSRILGDHGDSQPDKWLWGGDSSVDMVLLFYFDKNNSQHNSRCDDIVRDIELIGATLVFEQQAYVKRDDQGRVIENFGFVDGISQPIIKGTRKSYRMQHSDHVVAAGEFVCGYPDERGNIAQAPLIPCEDDLGNCLPLPIHRDDAHHFKEFGFNGSFLVIRQLQQHTDAFNELCQREAKRLKGDYGNNSIDKEWVAAKMIGRWRDGRPLISSPHRDSTGSTDNEFRYRKEDPQGINCPFGSHIRRANPRDSLGDDSQTQINLSNRHRILRRGRSYQRNDGREVGTLFMCVNADIERQFEFVQQTWLQNPNFSKLNKEIDPLFSTGCPMSNQYTMPGMNGGVNLSINKPLLTTRGGGYFFLPGRQALGYLSKL